MHASYINTRWWFPLFFSCLRTSSLWHDIYGESMLSGHYSAVSLSLYFLSATWKFLSIVSLRDIFILSSIFTAYIIHRTKANYWRYILGRLALFQNAKILFNGKIVETYYTYIDDFLDCLHILMRTDASLDDFLFIDSAIISLSYIYSVLSAIFTIFVSQLKFIYIIESYTHWLSLLLFDLSITKRKRWFNLSYFTFTVTTVIISFDIDIMLLFFHQFHYYWYIFAFWE